MDRRIKTIQQMLEKESMCGSRVRDLAALVNLSVSRTQHLFKQQTGITLGKYIRELRMRKAKELLDNSFFTVKEVMAKIGRADPSHFAREYRRAYGRTPSEYRQDLSEKHKSLET